MAWRFVSHLTQREAIEYLCTDLPSSDARDSTTSRSSVRGLDTDHEAALLNGDGSHLLGAEEGDVSVNDDDDHDGGRLSSEEQSFEVYFAGLNALEIAAVAGAKKFLSEKSIQRIINDIWNGDIVFWDALSAKSVKKARLYNRDRSDPFCRLRVPLYLKVFEVLFFAAFLAFYYAVLVEKQSVTITASETMLYIWIAAFSYNGKRYA